MSRYDYHHKTIGDSQYKIAPKKRKNRLIRSLFFLIIFVFIIALFVYVFPEVDVIIVPETEAIENNFDININIKTDKVDYKKNIFPAKIIEIKDSLKKTFITTGKKNIGEKAEGQVVFFNQTGLVQPITTENQLVTDNGIIFHVKHDVEIPKAEVSAEGNIIYGNITVPIVAVEAGEEGNVSPGRLTITDLVFSKQNKIYGEIQNKLTGGTSEVIQVVSEEDLKKAEEQLINELKPKLRRQVENSLASGQVLNNELFEYSVVNVEHAVELEEEIKEFDMKVVLSAKALVWDKNQVKQMILDKITSTLPKNKKIVETSRDIFNVEVTEANLEEGVAILKINTLNQVSLPIDTENLKNELKGLKEYEARRLLLTKNNIKDVRFKFRYSLTSKIPQNGNRINILLNF